MTGSRIREMSRRQARFVYDQAELWSSGDLKEITVQAQGLPVSLRIQGLLITLARLEISKNQAGQQLCRMLFEWLTKQTPILAQDSTITTTGKLIKKLSAMDRTTYLAVQTQALSLSERIKLIASALNAAKEGD